MEVGDWKERRRVQVIGIVVIVLMVLFVSGCTRLVFRSFRSSQESETAGEVEEAKEQVKGAAEEVDQAESVYKNDLCGVEFKYDAEKWQYAADTMKFMSNDWGSVTVRCEDIGSVPESKEVMSIDKIDGKVFKKEDEVQVMVNLPGGEVEWIMEGDKQAVEELAELVRFARVPLE